MCYAILPPINYALWMWYHNLVSFMILDYDTTHCDQPKVNLKSEVKLQICSIEQAEAIMLTSVGFTKVATDDPPVQAAYPPNACGIFLYGCCHVIARNRA